MPRRDAFAALGASLLAAGLIAAAASRMPARAGEADAPSVEAGRRLLAENQCDGACHRARANDADPTAIYRRAGRRVQSREELDRQVAFCVSRLGSMIFSEEIGSVAAALDHDHYRFD